MQAFTAQPEKGDMKEQFLELFSRIQQLARLWLARRPRVSKSQPLFLRTAGVSEPEEAIQARAWKCEDYLFIASSLSGLRAEWRREEGGSGGTKQIQHQGALWLSFTGKGASRG